MSIIAQWKALPKHLDRRNANNFSEGLNTAQGTIFAKDSTVMNGYGWDFNDYPALAVRKGRTAHGTTGSGVTRLLTNFGNIHLVRAVGTSLQYNSSGTTWTNIPGTFQNIDWDAANFDINGPALIMTNGTDTPVYWNGSVLANNASMPKGKYVAADNLRVYTAGVAGDLDSIYYCAFQNALDWSSPQNSGIVQYYTSLGGPITALHAFSGAVWAFKKDSFSIIYHTGDSRATHRLVPISDYIGCVSHKTLTQVGPYLMWLGADNVYIGAGDAAAEIGQPIKTYLQSINQSAIANSCAFADSQRYYLCIPTGSNTQPDTCLVYHYIYKKWLPYSISLGGLRFCAQLNGVAYAGDNAGQTFKMNDGTTDAGTAIPWMVESKPFDDGVKEAEKELYEMHMQGYFPSGTTLGVSISPYDQGNEWHIVQYDPIATSNVNQNKNLIIPLDTVPLCFFYRYRLTGTGPATIQEVQRYARITPIQY